jgi:pyruvate formate lyase activating enzyme
MKIGGFQKNSMIDFPGLVSSVIFTSGCNFICPYCHNPDLAAGRLPEGADPIEEADIFAFLNKRQGLIDGVVITGGEPTLQPDLERVITKIKALGFQIKLDTNGSHPGIVENLLDKGLLDFVAMDIKSDLDGYRLAAGERFDTNKVKESVRIIMAKAPAYEFRTTCVKPLLTKEKMADIGELIQGAKNYILQPCSQGVSMLNPLFFKEADRFFSDDEMLALKAEVEPSVNHCHIR